ncbi:antiviral reverse transcriptase Drt3b [Pseudomonas sp. JH-2]|uniref:antiviral reverse transcriptase Drt3b n=1 Tax=Pseudomonas sp. JH-2 TaxID=3114998 RepID=UPI002E256FD0|nr:antiviral reverse transcriptase Drt3b [Pseudomonas sp. JH-2]
MHKSAKQKIRVRKNDQHRAMLTETLPYEVPLLFSNEGLYIAAKRGITAEIGKLLKIFEQDVTIPYKYKIKKSSYESRGLAVMHPAQQLAVGRFYTKYEHILVALCQRSPFTLRAPSRIANYYYERARVEKPDSAKADHVELDHDGFQAEAATATSYFTYKKYPFMYHFYESHEFIKLEKKFKILCQIDISDCFNRIYTHTIAWAVKDKAYAKSHKTKANFENNFDKLMQNSNHGETAGIIIGPEVSRIFAEIILQRTDLEVKKAAKERGLEHDEDYAVRRYVDDYFIYSNSEATTDLIKSLISNSLSEFKLGINPAKTTLHTRPYITSTTIAKHNISSSISELFNKYRIQHIERDENKKITSIKTEIKPIQNTFTTSQQVIAAIKRAIGENGSYDTSANYLFGLIKKLLQSLPQKRYQATDGNAEQNLYSFLSVILDIVFFYYSMTPRVRQTYQLSEIILLVSNIARHCHQDVRDQLTQKIIHEARATMIRAVRENPHHKIEVLNLLIALRWLGERHILDDDFIHFLFDLKQGETGKIEFNGTPDYFEIMLLIAYIGGISRHTNIITCAIEEIQSRFTPNDWQESSELCCIFLDTMSCPYISTLDKTKLCKTVLRKITDKDITARSSKLLELTSSRNWFFDWELQGDLATQLRKKELRSAY